MEFKGQISHRNEKYNATSKKELNIIHLPRSVVESLMVHAMTTETEEVMGLIFGHYLDGVATIQQIYILTRNDKRKDRCEVSPDQLALASGVAEQNGCCVIGWYHSHPHITIHPSHVDVNTQFQYQYLDSSFFGLIMSVFSNDPNTKEGKINLIAFQSLKTAMNDELMIIDNPNASEYVDITIPIKVIDNIARNPFQSGDHNLNQLTGLQDILLHEEKNTYLSQVKSCNNSLGLVIASSEYQQQLTRLLEFSSIPFLNSLEEKLIRNKIKIEQLKETLNGL
jgi:BRCA1/BRCA2-containing complex subunit 3